MDKTAVRTENAPAPFQGAPYSQAIKTDELVFVSGQLGLKPGDTEMAGDTIEDQTRQVFDNLEAILTEAGSGLDRIVKTTHCCWDWAVHPKSPPPWRRWSGRTRCGRPPGSCSCSAMSGRHGRRTH